MADYSKPLSGGDYWEIIAEIDFLHFQLDQITNSVSKRLPIEQMIDNATGYDKKRFEDVKAIVGRIKDLQAMLPADDPHFKQADTTVNDLELKDD